MPDAEPIIIGWQEYIALPDWGIDAILAKSDTGARSSAIDVGHVERISDTHVAFDVQTKRKQDRPVHVVAEIARVTRVKSSFGHLHERYLVRTTLKIGPVEKTIELGLVNRKRMRCRMLLGRTTLAPDFVVDSSRAFVFGKPVRSRKTKKKSKKKPSPRTARSESS